MIEVPGKFADLYAAEYPRLSRSLRAIDEDAADAVQEAFVQALLRWRRVGELEDPVGWVRRVAVHRLLNVRRSRARAAAATARMVAGTTGARSEDRVDVLRAVRRLPRQQRVAVALYYGADLSVGQVSDAMGIATGTVKAHLHAARDALRELLGESIDE
ncbi:MAG TPA: sigma-70 family RNA polymerase sigma factor [Acidimicrobiia bacterium]|nr:sigma-70 family RNA polymerase sigma factor [Acidimicrobiia bacterium]